MEPSHVLLGYRFAQLSELRAHLHKAEGGALLYFPQPIEASRGASVAVEASFDGSDQTLVLRGTLYAHAGGGAWLLLNAPRWLEALPRRRHRRYATNLSVRAARTVLDTVACQLVDLSLRGARLAGLPHSWTPGDALDLHLPGDDGAIARATILRRDKTGAAILFANSLPATRWSVDTLLQSAAEAWSHAVTVVHPATCGCKDHLAAFEPVLPSAEVPQHA